LCEDTVAAPGPPPAEPPPPDPAPWGLRGAVLVTLLAYTIQILVLIALGALSSAVLVLIDPNLTSHPEELNDLVLLVSIGPGAIASSLLTLALIWFSVTSLSRVPFLEALHLRRPTASGLAGAVSLGMVIAALYVGLAVAFPPPEDVDLGGALNRLAESGPLGFAILVVLALAMAPLVEEVLFRGYAYLGAQRRLGTFGAGLAVTVVFVSLHMLQTGTYWPAIAGIATMASALVILMQRTGNLSYCIAGHLGYNATLALLSLFATGS